MIRIFFKKQEFLMYSRPSFQKVMQRGVGTSVEVNRVLKNTYFLLGLTLLFSALTASLAVAMHAPPMGFFGIIIMFGLLFLVQSTARSAWGIATTFLFTGFMGYTLGPMLEYVLYTYTNGAAIVGTALGATGFIFMTLSAYVLVSKKNFSYMGGMLMVAIMMAFVLSIAGFLFAMPFMQLIISAVFVLLSSALILFHTSAIIHGGERNYVLATISLYVALYNLFLSLLQILSIFGGSRN
jgi:modulator of FtsH protease